MEERERIENEIKDRWFKVGQQARNVELLEKFEGMINSEEQLCGMSKNQAKEVIMNLRTQLSELLNE